MTHSIKTLLAVFLLISVSLPAQQRWQTQSPTQQYWQQEIAYTIDATIDEKENTITGNQSLIYTNHSPDTLHELYFHLYQNAFQPNSYLDNLHRANHDKPSFGKYESQGLGTQIKTFTVNGDSVVTSIDNTIMHVFLNAPLLPGKSLTIQTNFITYFDQGSIGRRMTFYNSYGFKHYNGVHWYPRVSVYDRKFGWTTDQHLGREFYGDYGTFDVSLTFNSQFIVEATGALQNENEVLPEELKSRLAISNFKNKPFGSAPSIPIKYTEGETKTWKYHAENVHDFAFTADPTYRIGEVEWNGIKCIALVQEPHASKWQNAAEYTAKIIQTFSEDFGMYEYPKMVVADARDGMEYPMLTLDGGWDPNYRELLVHEVAHNWFYGMIGNNEAYRAPLDEGFTQFLTAWGLSKIDGDTLVTKPSSNKYIARFKRPEDVKASQVYYGYLRDAIKHTDPSLNTHSDDFNGALGQGGGYGHVYYKTATMLFHLQYVLGDELFQNAMRNYVHQWKFAHPYVEDFRNSIIQFTKVDLNWFFDQWWEQPKQLDYAIKKLKYNKKTSDWTITIERKGSMQMPLDFTVTTEDGKTHDFHIPNTFFVKKTDATVLPKWTGWGKLNKTYHANFKVNNKSITNVEIDKSKRLADTNPMNNSLNKPITVYFDSKVYNRPEVDEYEVFVRPDIWYNGYDGIKTGMHFNGNFLNYKHKIDGTVWFNTGFAQNLEVENKDLKYNNMSFRVNYENGIPNINKGASILAGIKSLDGLQAYKFGLKQVSENKKWNTSIHFNSLFRETDTDLNYLIYPTEWIAGMRNNYLQWNAGYYYDLFDGYASLTSNIRTSGLGSDYQYGFASLTNITQHNVAKLVINTRLFAQYGTGTMPLESSLFLAGANPENMMNNKYERSTGFIPNDYKGYSKEINHFQAGGGLNLRGFNGYGLTEKNRKGEISTAYRSQSGVSSSIEIDFNKYLPIKFNGLKHIFNMDMYVFADAGVVDLYGNSDRIDFSSIKADAGIGALLTWHNFGPFEMVNPLSIRVDFPLYVSDVPTNQNNFDFRWLIGINRTF
jgi:hypothetical protein